MKYDTNNGILLCREHHDEYHFGENKALIQKMIQTIGLENYNELALKSQKRTSTTHNTIKAVLKKLSDEACQLGLM